jgi:hypothetical protein
MAPMFSLPGRENTGKNRIGARLIVKTAYYIKGLRVRADASPTPQQGNFDRVLTP